MATRKSERVRRVAAGIGGGLLALALLAAAPARAQTDLGPLLVSGEVEFGGRLVWGDEGAAKFQEYRDLRDGVIGGFDLLFESPDVVYWSRLRGENVGYDDQRYWFGAGRYGRYEIEAFYGELPHIFSNLARTPYLRTANAFQLRPGFDIANPDPALFAPVDQELHWREGFLGGNYHFGESVLLKGSYRIQDKRGTVNWGMNFGSPGGTFTSIPAKIDERIHEGRVGVDWMLGNANFSAEYLGSFFQNNYSAVTAQNPSVTGDITGLSPGPEGSAATAPNNWAQSLSLSGAGSLPLGVPNQVAANFSYGYRYQNDNFLPHTINTAIWNPPGLVPPDLFLPASGLDGRVQTILGNLRATVQAAEDLSAKLSYRIYDLDNQTDSLLFPGNVRNDGTERSGDPHQSVALDYTRQNADLDLSWDFAESWTGVLGFGWEYWRRSSAREVRNLHDYGPTLKLDYRTRGGTLLHAGYEFRNRDGSTYDPLAPLVAVIPGTPQVCPGNPDKFCELRKFDEANRYLHRFDLLAKALPTERLEMTLTANVDYSDYRDTNYGLTEALGWHLGYDAYLELHPRVGVLGYYTYEWRKLWQDSRVRGFSAGMATEGPDWESETRYQYHNIGSTLRLVLFPEKLDVDLGYLLNFGQEKTRQTGVAAGAENLPSIEDTLQALYGTLAFYFSEDVTVQAGYRFEDYDIKNFRDDNVPNTLVEGFGAGRFNLYLGDVVDNYTAHIFQITASLRF